MQNNTLQMKRALRTALLVLLLSVVGMEKGYAQLPHDFWAVCETGQTLWYKCLNENCVQLTTPFDYGWDDNSPYPQHHEPYGNLELPSYVTLNGVTYTVTSIGANVFKGTPLTSVIIPNTITWIGDGAFQQCIDISTITIGSSVTSIGESAFNGCSRLVSITIPESVTSIGIYAFGGCTRLNSVSIGNSVVGAGMFAGCTNLTSVVLSESVTSIGKSAFSNCTSLTSFTIGDSVTSIGNDAFSYCTSLTSITIPESVSNIGERAFGFCSNLTSLNYEAKHCDCSYTSQYYYINHWLRDCPLSNITIGENVEVIPNGFVFICTNLNTMIYNAKNCSSFGSNWLPDANPSLKLIIGEAVESIPSSSFRYPFDQIVVEQGNTIYDSRENCNAIIKSANNELLLGIQNSIIPNSVTSIGVHAFYNCTGLASIVIPNSVTSIGSGAFYGCSDLSSINIPNCVSSIGDGAFYGCSGLSSVNIPNSTTTIGDYAFYGCTDLLSITIGNSVSRIGSYAFHGCSGLTSVTIPSSVDSIEFCAFSNCSRLTTVYYNAEKAVASASLFSYSVNGNWINTCPNLTTIHIGADVQEIGANIFRGCTGVHLIVALGPTPATLVGGAFADFADNSILMVSCGNKLNYFSVWNMFDFNNIMEDCSEYSIGLNNIGAGGSVSASTTQAHMGQEVQLTVTPNAGMVLSSISACNTTDPSQSIPIYPIGKGSSKYGFIMPPFGVSVMASFTTGTSVGESNSVSTAVYPNPTNGQVKIEAGSLKHITIRNLLGQTIFDGNATGNAFEYDFSKHKSGIYLIRIETVNGVAVKKVSVTQ